MVRRAMLMAVMMAVGAPGMTGTPALAQQRGDAPPPMGAPPGTDPRAPGNRPAMATIMVEPVGMMIAAMDRDDDAAVSRDEMTADVRRSFAETARGAADIGYIAFADWAERWLGDRSALPGAFEVDRNQDNRITEAELQARMSAIFDRLDADKDGKLVRRELLTIRSLTPPPLDPRRRPRR